MVYYENVVKMWYKNLLLPIAPFSGFSFFEILFFLKAVLFTGSVMKKGLSNARDVLHS